MLKEEIEILSDFKRGDINAFSLIYNMYSGKSYNFVFKLVKDDAVAKDIVQDTFIKLYLKRKELSEVGSFNSYIFKMLKNKVMDFFASESVRRKYIARMVFSQNEYAELVNEKIMAMDLEKLIAKAVSKMPVQRRDIFILSRFNCIPNGEIADMMGISPRTVENHLSNAMRDIRAAICVH